MKEFADGYLEDIRDYLGLTDKEFKKFAEHIIEYYKGKE